MATGFPLEIVKLYRALERELLNTRTAAREIALNTEGNIHLPPAVEADILFLIARDKSGEFHKWIWLLR
jgi:hypothetical protein